MEKITYKELENYLNEILDCDAFELHSDSQFSHGSDNSTKNFYIPYMMNDALECYLLLKNGRMTGKYLPDFKGEISAEFIYQPSDSTNKEWPDNTAKSSRINNSSAIIFRQGTDNVFTIWFEDAFRVLKCYRYDQIGHFWVKGEEHWRRLVYIIGTIYDKCEYMGNQVCNEKEIALLPLMEFAPFRMYSPIHESLDEYYSESSEGLTCMTSLAEEANDREFLRFLNIYRLAPTKFIRNILFHALNHPNRQKLYELIFYKVQEASAFYPERSYHPSFNAEIDAARKQTATQLCEKGFSGKYPLFQKENIQVLAMEEHPFTILEAKDFSFRIQLMMSETADDSSRLNAGFFKKRGNRSWIASDFNHI